MKLNESERVDLPTGVNMLNSSTLNKATAFTEEERDALGLRGLLPPRVFSQEEQSMRVLGNFRSKTSPIEKYIFLMSLQDRNEQLFYHTLMNNIEEMMPIIYTPTVGEACRKYAAIFRRPRGLYVSANDRGRVAQVIGNWPAKDVRIVVVTDGERILGLGDLGANGMGIPIGKLALYTVCAGLSPRVCLPVTLDVGTGNEELLADPLYIGLRQPRIRGEEYDALVEEFMTAMHAAYPKALIQFEDFSRDNAFPIMERYRDRYASFNDDIQGTAAVALAGLLSAGRITGIELSRQTFLFLGAGEAGLGIGNLVVSALVREGIPEADARRRCWYVDSGGLVVKSREGLHHHKLPYAHDHEYLPGLLEAVRALKPTSLIGVSAQPETFTEPVIRAMAEINERPVIFALSNPTSKSECTAEQAYGWSGGKAIFASGSPFDPVVHDGRTHVPGQGNNVYIFPGLGLGAVACGARRITNEMFFVAARTLSEYVTDESLETGCVYPPLPEIREVSARIAERVAEEAYKSGLASVPRPGDLGEFVRSQMYDPAYSSYV